MPAAAHILEPCTPLAGTYACMHAVDTLLWPHFISQASAALHGTSRGTRRVLNMLLQYYCHDVLMPQAYPLDLVRTRLAVQTQGSYYHGILPTLQRIVADEGAVGLYRGLGATLLQVRRWSGCAYVLVRTRSGCAYVLVDPGSGCAYVLRFNAVTAVIVWQADMLVLKPTRRSFNMRL
jgi:hypothetical protein